MSAPRLRGGVVGSGAADPVALRRLPYPYQAMLAICSDLDETPGRTEYLETARYLNTEDSTRLGPGLGLEVGNTIYFDMPPDQFAYWNTDDAGRSMVRALARSGHIDCLHSFGDLGTTRAHAARALDELERHGCRLGVWIDHGAVRSNFGQDIMRGTGDVPGSESYHADLTCAYGVEFVWRGRATSVIGQETRRRLGGIFNWKHALVSMRTLGKEHIKGMAGRAGSTKYAPHAKNDVLWPVTLRSGHAVTEFFRSNPSWGGISHNDMGRGIGEVLTDAMLNRLVAREGTMILYTHLGKTRSGDGLLPHDARRGLARLSRFHRGGLILVSTTRRVLGYCRAVRDLALSTTKEDGRLTVHVRLNPRGVSSPAGAGDLDGVTIYVPDPARTRLVVNDRDAAGVRQNPPDRTGRGSVSIPWTTLEFPEV